MFWFWVAVVVVVVLALAAWSSWRAKRVHGDRTVRSSGAADGRREGLSPEARSTWEAGQANRGDQQALGG